MRCVAFSPDCKGAVTASEDHTVKLWNLDVRFHMQVGGVSSKWSSAQ